MRCSLTRALTPASLIKEQPETKLPCKVLGSAAKAATHRRMNKPTPLVCRIFLVVLRPLLGPRPARHLGLDVSVQLQRPANALQRRCAANSRFNETRRCFSSSCGSNAVAFAAPSLA